MLAAQGLDNDAAARLCGAQLGGKGLDALGWLGLGLGVRLGLELGGKGVDALGWLELGLGLGLGLGLLLLVLRLRLRLPGTTASSVEQRKSVGAAW